MRHSSARVSKGRVLQMLHLSRYCQVWLGNVRAHGLFTLPVAVGPGLGQVWAELCEELFQKTLGEHISQASAEAACALGGKGRNHVRPIHVSRIRATCTA